MCCRKNGKGLLNQAINHLPFELHIPGYQFCGPGTNLQQRLIRGDQGINPLDAACRLHDIEYSKNQNLVERHKADHDLAARAKARIIAKDSTVGERAAAAAVWIAMKGKTKMGMGMNQNARAQKNKKNKKKNKKKKQSSDLKKIRSLSIAKRGGFLPFLFPALSALGALTGGAAGVYKAVADSKAAQKQLAEAERHNRSMEGHGLYLTPYKNRRGGNMRSDKKKKKKLRNR